MTTGKSIEELAVGESAEFAKTITETDIYLYAGITGDMNPAHINEEFARETTFKSRIAHGMLTAGLISAILGNNLPGPGTIHLKQELAFTSPVYMGDTVTARVEVSEINKEKNKTKLKTTCVNQENETVLAGEAQVMPPQKGKMRSTQI